MQITRSGDNFSGASSQVSLLEFGEDVKKRLRLLSEVVLRAVKRRLTCRGVARKGVDGRLRFAIFLAKKMAAENFIDTHHSDWLFELKNSEFRCEIKF